MLTVRDLHAEDGTTEAQGLWITSRGKIGLDVGETIHCINAINTKGELTRTSVSGTYMPAAHGSVRENVAVFSNDLWKDSIAFRIKFKSVGDMALFNTLMREDISKNQEMIRDVVWELCADIECSVSEYFHENQDTLDTIMSNMAS